MHVRFAAEPGELTFRILPGSLLNRISGDVERHLSAKVAAQLSVANELKRFGSFW